MSLCLTLFACGKVGDQEAPGVPLGFQFICDATTLASTCPEPNARVLTWVAPGDDGNGGRTLQYDLRWAYEAMTDAAFASANQFIDEPIPQPFGTRETIFIPRMTPGLDLSFGLRAFDEIAQGSPIVITDLVQLDFLRTPFGSGGVTQPGFGTVTELLGDLNGLGTFDMGVGAPSAVDPVSTNAAGAVYIYFNATRDFLMTTENGFLRTAAELKPSVVIYGAATGDLFGASIAAESDFNGDGVLDLAVGAPGAGRAYIFFGGAAGVGAFSSKEINPTAPARLTAADADVTIIGPLGFGSSMAFPGEINNLAGGEILVGSPTEGRAYLFYGGLQAGHGISGATPLTVDLTAAGFADWTIIGPLGSDFGKTVARIANIDGNVEDFAIAAPGTSQVYLFFGGAFGGKALDLSLAGPQTQDLSAGADFDLLIIGEAGSQFGAAMSGRNDLNLAGFASLVIGAPATNKVYAFFGGTSGVITFPPAAGQNVHDAILDGADFVITGDPATNFGAALTTRSDLDGDTFLDLLIGTPDAAKAGAGTPGAIYQFTLGPSNFFDQSIADADFTVYGLVDLGRFGASVCGVGDMVPHDPIIRTIYFSDFIAGAPGANAAYSEY